MLGLPLPDDRPPRVLGLFAHPDDEVFCFGGTVSLLTDAGATARVVSLTRGDAGQIRDASVATRRTLAGVREHELAAACAELGVTDVRCHDHRDGTLATLPLDDLVELAVAEIDAFRPDVVVSFADDGGYGHPDHVTVSRAATAAAAASATRPTVLHALFPQTGELLLDLLISWLGGLDDRFRGSEEFANGLMLFANGSSMLGQAADHMEVRFVPAGTYIVEQGEPPGELFLVLSGEVDVLREAEDGTTTPIARLGPGSFFGEEGIATGSPRNAHVVARTGTTCFVLAPGAATLSAGRGDSSPLDRFETHDVGERLPPGCITVDVRPVAMRKIAALARHRSQYAVREGMFPPLLVEGVLGREHFLPVDTGTATA